MPTVYMNEARTYTSEGVVLIPGANAVTDEQLAAMDVPGSGFRYRKNMGVLTVQGAHPETVEGFSAPLTDSERREKEKLESTVSAQADELAKLRAELTARDEVDAERAALADAKTPPPAVAKPKADAGKQGA